MKSLIENYDKLYPGFKTRPFSGTCLIDEQDAEDDKHSFRKLIIKHVDGWQFPHEQQKKIGSFYDMAQKDPSTNQNLITDQMEKDNPCYVVVKKDCDSIFCTEDAETGMLTLYVCELKSSYNPQDIAKAKNQIVGSYQKLLGALSMLQKFNPQRIAIKGVIAAYKPNTQRLSGIKNLRDPIARFCTKLHDDGHYLMPKDKCEVFFHPLTCTDIDIKFVAVPQNQREYTIDFAEIK